MKQNKTILFLSNMASPYQIENCKYLNEKTSNDYYFIFYLQRESNRPSYWDDIPFKPKNIKVLNRPFKISEQIYINFDVLKNLKELNPDIVIVGGYTLFTGIYAAIWAKLNGKKTILYLERFLPSSNIKRYFKSFILKLVSKLFDQFILAGNDAYKEYYFIKNKRNIPYLINLDRYYDSDKKYFKDNKINFLYSGRFSKNQNVYSIVEAFIQLSEKYTNIKLILSGYGEELHKIQSKIKLLNKEAVIEIDNRYKSWFELPELYNRADILVAPLNHSGWGFVIEEAMASSLAVISTYETTAAAEYIIDNYNGFINTSSINDIKNSMEKYILDKELIIKHGKRNFDLKKDVSYEYMINKYNKAIFED